MGFIEKLLRHTPFYHSYKNFLRKKVEGEQKILERQLHPARVLFYRQFISPNDLVFDVGANVGNRVASFLECGASVVAVEPQPSCVAVLKEKFGDKIIIENYGLGHEAGRLMMKVATDSTVSSFNQDYINSTKQRFKYTEWVDEITVEVTTMDELIAKHGLPKFVKIDVEGFELEVLRGLHRKVPYLSIEYCVPEMHHQLIDCISYLSEICPEGAFNYSIGESMSWALPSWIDYNSFLHHISTEQFIKSSFGDVYFKSV
jgi:FkbM family methyltransferase